MACLTASGSAAWTRRKPEPPAPINTAPVAPAPIAALRSCSIRSELLPGERWHFSRHCSLSSSAQSVDAPGQQQVARAPGELAGLVQVVLDQGLTRQRAVDLAAEHLRC